MERSCILGRDARRSILAGVSATFWNDGPIGLGEFHAPEVRRRRQKLDAHALATAGILAEVDDAAFLVFLGKRVGDNKLCIVIERVR